MKTPSLMTMLPRPVRGLLLFGGVLSVAGSATTGVPAPDNGTLTGIDLRAPGLHRMGSEGAPFVLIEFSDYGCPHCALFHEIVFPKIRREYIDTGRLAYVAMHSPRAGMPASWLAAEAALAASEQGKFWEMRDLLFANSRNLNQTVIEGLAQHLGLNTLTGDQIDSDRLKSAVEAERRCGKALGVTGTPSFLMARVENGAAVDGKLSVGVIKWSTFRSRMDALLKSSEDSM